MSDLFLGTDVRERDPPEVEHEVLKTDKSAPEPVLVNYHSPNQTVKADLTPSEQARHHRVREHMQERRDRKASKKALKANQEDDHCAVLVGVNLRDVGAVTRGPMRNGALYRSSELLSKEEMKKHNIRTILDLRRMDRPCKKGAEGNKVAESTKTVITYLLLGPKKLIPEKRLLYQHRAHPQNCPLCHTRACKRFEADINVIHADLIPSTVGLRIFQAMPVKVQAKALVMACTGKGAASVMAPAVASPLLLGYKALYITLLEDSKRGMALALRPFVEEDNYPVLVHCIHGKDRTGLIIMLLLLLCNVEAEAIVDDYVLSETVLKESRMHDELKLDVYLTSDDVIAATRDTMEDTINYIKEKYGDAAGYMSEIGMEEWEIEMIRKNLMKPDFDEMDRLPSKPLKSRFSIQALFPFGRREATPQQQQRKAANALARNSVPLPAAKISSNGSDAQPAASPHSDSDAAQPMFRRASLASSGPAEIRGILKQMREQHPELGPVTEEGPVDFLRSSPVPAVKVVMTDPGATEDRSNQANGEGQAAANKQWRPQEAAKDAGNSTVLSTSTSGAEAGANGVPTRMDAAFPPIMNKPVVTSNARECDLPPSPFAAANQS